MNSRTFLTPTPSLLLLLTLATGCNDMFDFEFGFGFGQPFVATTADALSTRDLDRPMAVGTSLELEMQLDGEIVDVRVEPFGAFVVDWVGGDTVVLHAVAPGTATLFATSTDEREMLVVSARNAASTELALLRPSWPEPQIVTDEVPQLLMDRDHLVQLVRRSSDGTILMGRSGAEWLADGDVEVIPQGNGDRARITPRTTGRIELECADATIELEAVDADAIERVLIGLAWEEAQTVAVVTAGEQRFFQLFPVDGQGRSIYGTQLSDTDVVSAPAPAVPVTVQAVAALTYRGAALMSIHGEVPGWTEATVRVSDRALSIPVVVEDTRSDI